MRTVLMDNTSISHIFGSLNPRRMEDKSSFNDLYFQEYIYVSVLWEKIYCSSIRNSYERKVLLLENVNNIEQTQDRDIWLMKHDAIRNALLDANDVSALNFEQFNDLHMLVDVIWYYKLGEYVNSPVLLTKERTELATKYQLNENVFDRRDILKLVDKDVQEYYQDINKRLGKNVISFSTPLLVDYVLNQSENCRDALTVVKQLSEERDLIDFRNAMEKMENALQSGNIKEFDEYLKAVEEIVDDILHKRHTLKTDIQIGITPSITIPIEKKGEASLSKKINLRFLKDLTTFGITSRSFL